MNFHKSYKLTISSALIAGLLISSTAVLAGSTEQKAKKMLNVLFDEDTASDTSSSTGVSGSQIKPTLEQVLSDLERAEKTLMSIKPELQRHKQAALNHLRISIKQVKFSMDYAEKNF
jgi:hypothetical protein